MEPTRTILHSDLNCFYASVEMMLNPALRDKAVAVCGSTEDRHGIVLAKSEKAKKAGIKTGMVNWEARQLCPELITVPPQYDQYLKYSELTRNIYKRYTDLIEPFGMDEAWCEVTGCQKSGTEIAEEIRQAVKDELGMTVSIGVSFNKIFAKLGSDMKKPDAITVIRQEDYKDMVWPLPASDLLYVGRATTKKLASYGIHTIGAIAQAGPEFLQRLLGINGLAIWQYAAGLDHSRVMPLDYQVPVKSIGHGITCTADLLNEEEVWRVMLELAQDIGHRLRVHKLAATGVQIAVRSNELSWRQYQAPLPYSSQSPMEIACLGRELFRKRHVWTAPVRSITIRAINLVPQDRPMQASLFYDLQRAMRRERLDDTVDEIRRRFGSKAIYSAACMGDLKMPGQGTHEVIMPSIMYQ
ncbi:MAG: DNA polymerase IV [Faecousia sp.]